MPGAAFYGLPHSESEVYCLKVSAIGRQSRAQRLNWSPEIHEFKCYPLD